MENVLIAHMIVSSLGGQSSTRMQLTEPTDLAEKWGIGLEAACRTLECTTQRGLWTVIHPYLSRRFQTYDWQLEYRRLRYDVFGDTLLAGKNSKCGNNYTKVFVIKFGWSCSFPMSKNGGAHEDLSLLFQRYEVLPKMIFDGSKEQTLDAFKRKVAEA